MKTHVGGFEYLADVLKSTSSLLFDGSVDHFACNKIQWSLAAYIQPVVNKHSIGVRAVLTRLSGCEILILDISNLVNWIVIARATLARNHAS